MNAIVYVVLFVVGVYLLKKYMAGGVCRSTARLDGKVVVITGANTGIGKETAIDLAKRNARLILACRDMEKAQKAVEEIKQKTGNQQVYARQLDLASFASIRSFAAKFLEEEKELHILINNAGVMWSPLSMKTKDGFELQFGTNHLGTFLLTNLLLDRLKACAPSRIVTLSSLAHLTGVIDFDDLNSEKRNTMAAYGQSKLANILMTKELARRLPADSNVHVYALHPGAVDTELIRWVGVPAWLHKLTSPISYVLFKSPKEGAQTSIYCAVDERAGKETGLYYSDCAVKTPNKAARDMEVARKLWEVSEKLVNQASKTD